MSITFSTDTTVIGPSAHTPSTRAPAPAPGSVLPILDLSDFTSGDAERRATFVTRLRETAHHVGFFYLRGYGASPAQVDAVLQAARDFFALPETDKQAVHMAHSLHFRGYTAAGDEITRGARDWREQLDIGAERVPLAQQPTSPAWTRLQGPNQWPTSLPQLKPTLLAWQDTLTETAGHLLHALALALGQPQDRFDAAFADTPVQHLKVIHYPGRAQGESRQGVGPHKDSGCLTQTSRACTWSIHRTFAATPAPVTRSRAARATGVSNLTMAPSVCRWRNNRPRPPGPGCKGPISGRPPCRSSNRPCWPGRTP